MGNKKNHAKKNKRLANNWRNIIKTRKVRPQKKALPRSFCLGDTRVVYVDENVNRCPDFESNSDNNSWNNNLLSNTDRVDDSQNKNEEQIIIEENEINSVKSYVSDNCLVLSNNDVISRLQETQNNVKNNKQKYYVLQKFDLNQHTRIIRADFHQGDLRFELSRDKQHVAISVVALSFFKINKDPETWITAYLNQILITGDVQYNASYKKMKREGKTPQTQHLTLSEVYPYIKIGRKYYYLNETDADSINLEKDVLKRDNLEKSLDRFFIENRNVCGIFTYKIFSFAIMRTSNSFFLFNSRASSYDGEPMDPFDQESAACLMQTYTITCLASCLLIACNQRHMIFDDSVYDQAGMFSITTVNISQKVFAYDSKRKKVIRDLGNFESRGRSIERKRKSKFVEKENIHAKLKQRRVNPETNPTKDDIIRRRPDFSKPKKNQVANPDLSSFNKWIETNNGANTRTSEVQIGCGMLNVGNSCFFNACFQAFFHIPVVNIRLQKLKRKKCTCLVCGIINLFKDTHDQENLMPYNPKKIYESLRLLNADLLNGKQQDAQELWMRIMKVFENRRNSSTMFDRLFTHDVITNVKCENCFKEFLTERETRVHIIEVGGRPTIQVALDDYFAGDVVETYKCSKCDYINKDKSKKKYFLKSAPNMLCLMLNRFKMKTKKNRDDIELNEQLTLTNFSSSSKTTSAKYKLVSTINHIGMNISSGHYTATACCSNKTFYEFDDTRVKNIDSISGRNAYILFYQLSAKLEIDPDFDMETDRADEREYNIKEENINEEESISVSIHDTPENDNDTSTYQQDENVDTESNKLSGSRIVEIGFLLEQMKYINRQHDGCDSGLVFRKETKLGFRSIFHFECADCGVFHHIQSSSKNTDYMNINKAATLGMTSIGSGFYHLQELCAHLNIPCMSSYAFDKQNKRIQKDWSELAKHHTQKALLEEVRHAIAIGNVDSAGNALITVVCDGSWGKRSYGKGFSSLSGCAAIIGLYTKKVIYFGVKNKYCHTCTLSYAKFCPPNYHECNISYVGPSSGMETEILVEGFLFCQEFGARFNKIVSDGDSSAFKEITEQCVYQNPDIVIEKIECGNHLYKNARKKLGAICTDTDFKIGYRKLLKESIGDDLCKAVRSAAKHWRESKVDMIQKLDNLEKDCLNAPYHYFGNHDNCNQYFCKKTTTDQSNATITLLKSCGIFHEILNYCNIYFASNVKSLLQDQTNNAAEELNNVIAKYLGGKRINYSLAGSYAGRVSAAVVQFNSKGHAGSQFHEHFSLNANNYCLKIENERITHYANNEIARQKKPRNRAIKDKAVKGYKAQKEDLSESALQVAMNIELDKVNINRTDRDIILASTLGQKHNHRWKEIRKKLINCNYFGRIINARGPTSYQKLLEEMLYSPMEWSNTADVRHQRLYEHEALKMFSLVHKDYELEKTGVFIDEELGFLGASPLRLFGPNIIVNVQCPIKAFKNTFDDAIRKKLVPLFYEDGNIQINKKSSWYIEVQGQLHITGRTLCYLMVWLGAEYTIIKVAVDHSFWENKMKSKLHWFFNEAMLKELANSRRGRKMDLRKYDPQTKKFI